MQRGDCSLHALDAGAEIGAFEPAGDGDIALQVFAADLLFAGGVLDVAIGLMLIYVALPRRTPSRTPTLATIVVASILVFLASSRVRFDRTLLSSGVYRYGGLPAPGEFATIFYKDGRTATVTVNREPDGNLILSTNGKPDASVPGDWLASHAARKRGPLRDDVSTQVLLPLIAMAHAPRARTAAAGRH